MGASGTAYGRGRFPNRVGIGGRWNEPEARQGMPGGRWHDAETKPAEAFRAVRAASGFILFGVTMNRATGVPEPTCEVELYHTATRQFLNNTVSDGSGNFSFVVGNNSDYYKLEVYKEGVPDVSALSSRELLADRA